jgi:Flp pilus assembly protein TadG
MSHRRHERGAAAVETALCICFIVLPLVFAIIAYAWMFSFRQTLSQAATEGARAGAVKIVADPAQRESEQKAAAIAAVEAAMDTSANSLECNGAGHLTCDVSFVACPNVPSGTCVEVKVSYPYRDHPLLPTVPGLGFTLPPTIGYSAVSGVS